MQRAGVLRVARASRARSARRSRRCPRGACRRASSSPTGAGPSPTRRRASRRRDRRGSARPPCAWRRRRPGRGWRGRRPRRSSARRARRSAPVRAAYALRLERLRLLHELERVRLVVRVHRALMFGPSTSAWPQYAMAQVRVESCRLAKGAAGLGVVEPVGEVQALVDEALGAGVRRVTGNVWEPRFWRRGASSPVGPGWQPVRPRRSACASRSPVGPALAPRPASPERGAPKGVQREGCGHACGESSFNPWHAAATRAWRDRRQEPGWASSKDTAE